MGCVVLCCSHITSRIPFSTRACVVPACLHQALSFKDTPLLHAVFLITCSSIFAVFFPTHPPTPLPPQVIFVDADQVVREDMGRLYDMPLHGHPLAYTPMCDNNRDMEGYRFWKQ
ncbi:unnamed protein product, partial [Closterium sp. NIES-54]